MNGYKHINVQEYLKIQIVTAWLTMKLNVRFIISFKRDREYNLNFS